MKNHNNPWLEFAVVDLNSAGKLLEDETLTQTAAFHCQQAAEKSLKAVLEYNNISVPRIHDLTRLYAMVLETGNELAVDEDLLAQINDVYIETRYPSNLGLIPSGIPKVSTVKEFYKQANLILDQVKEQLV